ncbi:hypothetical protein NDU88_001393 [Pleurodeles waltl]|uniref:Uncharacterized protein n=1 Tax=Pleurodeles waltl TaxID=8319 RepID=A0AAV7THH3_PLEWA|nr:hypothetical protein NDU88_001393 [Pleurodeles waltl]
MVPVSSTTDCAMGCRSQFPGTSQYSQVSTHLFISDLVASSAHFRQSDGLARKFVLEGSRVSVTFPSLSLWMWFFVSRLRSPIGLRSLPAAGSKSTTRCRPGQPDRAPCPVPKVSVCFTAAGPAIASSQFLVCSPMHISTIRLACSGVVAAGSPLCFFGHGC